MANIFVSYARADKARVQPLVSLLESKGWTVWWDTRIDVGERWDEVIEREIKAAHCIVVVWSSTSVSHHWVREEAHYGQTHHILIPVRIDLVEMPLGYALYQSLNMVGWSGRADDPIAENLVIAVRSKLGEKYEILSATSLSFASQSQPSTAVKTPGGTTKKKQSTDNQHRYRDPLFFVSYRQEDIGVAGRICDRLRARFGRTSVFVDMEAITPGSAFPADISAALNECKVFWQLSVPTGRA